MNKQKQVLKQVSELDEQGTYRYLECCLQHVLLIIEVLGDANTWRTLGVALDTASDGEFVSSLRRALTTKQIDRLPEAHVDDSWSMAYYPMRALGMYHMVVSAPREEPLAALAESVSSYGNDVYRDIDAHLKQVTGLTGTLEEEEITEQLRVLKLLRQDQGRTRAQIIRPATGWLASCKAELQRLRASYKPPVG